MLDPQPSSQANAQATAQKTSAPAPLFAFWTQALLALLPDSLRGQADALAAYPAAPRTRAGLKALLLRPSQADQFVADLSRALNLQLEESLCCALLLAVERDPVLPPLLGALQHPYGGTRPSLGLIERLLGDLVEGDALAGRLRHGPLSEAGVLLWDDAPDLPLVQQSPRLHPELVASVMHPQGLWPGTRLLESQTLPPALLEAVHKQASALRGIARAGLVLRCVDASEARAVAAGIARCLMRKPVWLGSERIDPAQGVWCELSCHLPVLSAEAAPGETVHLPALPGYSGPLLVVTGPDGRFSRDDGGLESWRIPVTGATERAALWREALPELEQEDLGQRYRVGAQRIKALAQRARRRAQLEGRPVEFSDLRRAAWGDRQALGGLAEPVSHDVPDAALVLRDATREELNNLLRRCKRREDLAQGLGVTLRTRYQSGVRALFFGPSGTGKTLAAAWLATRLGLPLYRVDSAAVSSKYIGETEKNLARLLARAEADDVVLLFDEADALFGKRTDIKDSNDRFANAQTNFLLQRIESYDGIVVLTSNSRQRLDAAFTRRLDVIMEFPAPGPEERRDLWLSHLGERHSLRHSELNMLAACCDISGGQIRNIVLDAAVRAGTDIIDCALLCQAVAAEYRKQGKPVPGEVRQFLADAP